MRTFGLHGRIGQQLGKVLVRLKSSLLHCHAGLGTLFVAAKLEDAALSAPDEQIRANVVRLGSALIDDFADFEEEIA